MVAKPRAVAVPSVARGLSRTPAASTPASPPRRGAPERAGEAPKARAVAVSPCSRTQTAALGGDATDYARPRQTAPEGTMPARGQRSSRKVNERNETMSCSLNKVQLIGNLGADPESRMMQNGGLVVTFSLATDESWRDQTTGERRTRTEWHRVVIFDERLGKVVEKHLTKGAKIYVEGMLRTHKWRDPEGHDRYRTEIHLTPGNGTLTFFDIPGHGEGAPGAGAQDPDATVRVDARATR
jgi:single-strand DNA-binding protein